MNGRLHSRPKWLVVPFGLTNALSTFMRLMNEVLKKFLRKFVIVYLDDILIFSKSLDENLLHIHSVLKRLMEDFFLINLKKCSFLKREVVYLGFGVSTKGLKMDPEKVKVILEWPTPRSTTEVRSFHGLAIFYRKFITNFSSICEPLTKTMRRDRKEFKWTTRATRSFELLKKKVIEQVVGAS